MSLDPLNQGRGWAVRFRRLWPKIPGAKTRAWRASTLVESIVSGAHYLFLMLVSVPFPNAALPFNMRGGFSWRLYQSYREYSVLRTDTDAATDYNMMLALVATARGAVWMENRFQRGTNPLQYAARGKQPDERGRSDCQSNKTQVELILSDQLRAETRERGTTSCETRLHPPCIFGCRFKVTMGQAARAHAHARPMRVL